VNPVAPRHEAEDEEPEFKPLTPDQAVARILADLLDIRNFGAKSIDEVKAKLAGMGLTLKDSPPGFDPASIADTYADDYDDLGDGMDDEF